MILRKSWSHLISTKCLCIYACCFLFHFVDFITCPSPSLLYIWGPLWTFQIYFPCAGFECNPNQWWSPSQIFSENTVDYGQLPSGVTVHMLLDYEYFKNESAVFFHIFFTFSSQKVRSVMLDLLFSLICTPFF